MLSLKLSLKSFEALLLRLTCTWYPPGLTMACTSAVDSEHCKHSCCVRRTTHCLRVPTSPVPAGLSWLAAVWHSQSNKRETKTLLIAQVIHRFKLRQQWPIIIIVIIIIIIISSFHQLFLKLLRMFSQSSFFTKDPGLPAGIKKLPFGHSSHVTDIVGCMVQCRTSVFDQQTFAVLRSTCRWRMTTYVGKPSAVGQPTGPTQPFILSG